MLVVASAGVALTACGGNKTAANTSTTTKPPAHSTTTTAPHAASGTTTTLPQYTIPLVQHGAGPTTLSAFKVPASAKEWDLDWVYDCSAQPTKKGSFSVTVVGHGSSAETTDAGVPEQSGGGTAGIVKNYDTGSFSLKVATPCKWDVRVEVHK